MVDNYPHFLIRKVGQQDPIYEIIFSLDVQVPKNVQLEGLEGKNVQYKSATNAENYGTVISYCSSRFEAEDKLKQLILSQAAQNSAQPSPAPVFATKGNTEGITMEILLKFIRLVENFEKKYSPLIAKVDEITIRLNLYESILNTPANVIYRVSFLFCFVLFCFVFVLFLFIFYNFYHHSF